MLNFLIALPLLSRLSLPPLPKPPLDTYKIVDVIDGDTIVTDKSQKVRLLAVDAPPLDLCGGQQAKAKLESLVKGKKVKLYEVVADNYGRIVALIYQGQTSVNLEMVKSGWGKYSSIRTSQKDALLYYSQQAQEKKRGVFSLNCRQYENPVNSKCSIKGNISRDGRSIYLFPGCSDYSQTAIEKNLGDRWFCSEVEAQKAGFVKSQNCYNKTY